MTYARLFMYDGDPPMAFLGGSLPVPILDGRIKVGVRRWGATRQAGTANPVCSGANLFW